MRDRRPILMTVLMGGEAASTLLNGLAAYWKLDEVSDGSGAVTRVDQLGVSNLTDNGTTPSAAGKVGLAALFTAANTEYLTVSDNASLKMGDIDFTICAWSSIPATNVIHDLINKYNSYGTGQREYSLMYSAGADLRFVFLVSPNGATPVAQVLAATLGLPTINTLYFIRAWHDATANTINIQVNNGVVDSTAHATGVFSGTSPLMIGALPAATRYSSATIDEVGIWRRLLTDAEVTLLYNGGSGNSYPFDARPVTSGQIIFDGNSMTATASSSYPSTAVGLLSGLWMPSNFGVSGQTTIEMLADAAAQIDAIYSARYTQSIVVCWEGTNDLRLGAARADAQARLVQYCQGRQAAGWKVVIVTILPRTQVGLPGTFEADRIAINAYILANYATFADAVADVAADGRIGDFGDSDDATYYTDGIHMTTAGYNIVAGIVATAVNVAVAR